MGQGRNEEDPNIDHLGDLRRCTSAIERRRANVSEGGRWQSAGGGWRLTHEQNRLKPVCGRWHGMPVRPYWR